jgi:hypothetical protein
MKGNASNAYRQQEKLVDAFKLETPRAGAAEMWAIKKPRMAPGMGRCDPKAL